VRRGLEEYSYLSWAILVRKSAIGVDGVEGLAGIVGERVGGGDGLPTGLDLGRPFQSAASQSASRSAPRSRTLSEGRISGQGSYKIASLVSDGQGWTAWPRSP
jgi:hypothetical protein